jgi:hypothetical protein
MKLRQSIALGQYQQVSIAKFKTQPNNINQNKIKQNKPNQTKPNQTKPKSNQIKKQEPMSHN